MREAATNEWQHVKVEGGRAMAALLAYKERIRAIDVDEVLSGIPTAPDAVAQLVEAARAALNYLENTEGEFGITLGSATNIHAALAQKWGEA